LKKKIKKGNGLHNPFPKKKKHGVRRRGRRGRRWVLLLCVREKREKRKMEALHLKKV